MKDRIRDLLADMVASCERIAAFTRGRTSGDLDKDDLLRSGVDYQLIVIGEAMASILRHEPSLQEEIPDARKIIAMRNVLVHNYEYVNSNTLWLTVTVSTPALHKRLKSLLQPKTLAYERKGFEEHYASGRRPWDSGEVDAELMRLLDAGQLPGRTVLEIGCGTGTNAVEFARRGYSVVAVDFVAQAIDEARAKAAAAKVKVDFRVADVLADDLGGPYDVVFDRGVYHGLRKAGLAGFLRMIEKSTRKGSRYLALAGNAKEQAEQGPPRVHEHEFRSELGGLFDFLEVREFRFSIGIQDLRPLGWAILMERK